MIEVSERQAVHGALTVVPGYLAKRSALPGVEVYRSGLLNITHDDVGALVTIQVSDRQAVRGPLGTGKSNRFSEPAMTLIEEDEGSLEALINNGQIGSPVSIKVSGRAHANPGPGWS